MLTTIPRIRKVPLQWQSGLLSLIALASVSLPASAQFNPPPFAVLTQRYDPQRTGANLDEHVLTVESVASPDFQKLYTIPVTGQVYAQPLLVPQVRFPDGTSKNILIVATMHNDVFAFQVDDVFRGAFPPQQLWSLNIGPALPSNFMPMGYSKWANICCGIDSIPLADPPASATNLPPVGSTPGHMSWGFYQPNNGQGLYNINPSIGILSTPVIDRVSNTLFVVGKVNLNTGPENHLVAIDLLRGVVLNQTRIDGSVKGSAPDSPNGTTLNFDQAHQMQRPALLLQNGELYIAFGSHQDTPPWHGWIFRYDANTLRQSGVWCSTPNSGGGSVWQAGSGIASDALGRVYVMTGNGCSLDSSMHCAATEFPPELNPPADTSFNGITNFANMFVRLNPDLSAPLGIPPADETHRNSEDLDVGSAGPVFIPGTNNLVGGDKEGRFFVLSTSPQFQLKQTFQVALEPEKGPSNPSGGGYHHIHGTPVFWRGPQGMTAYVWPERDYLRAFYWDDTQAQFDCAQDTNGCENGNTTIPDQQSTLQSPTCTSCMPGGFLSISAAGATSGTGVLWASLPQMTNTIRLVGGALNNVVPGILRAINPEDITQELWNSENNSGRDGSYMFAKYNPPMVANGRVYMATFGSIPNNGAQDMTGSINVYGMRQWAKFLSQSYPSGQIPIGPNFQATLTFFNAGTTTWTQGSYTLTASPNNSNVPTGTPVSIPLPMDVGPGNQVTFTLNLPASIADTFSYQWQMSQANVESFGEPSLWASVQVGGRLSVALSTALGKTTATITDAATKRPVEGATVLVNGLCEQNPCTTDAQGKVVFPASKCSVSAAVGGGGRSHPVTNLPCPATAFKPGYARLSFFVDPIP
jgi:hypothetical protein